MQIANWRRLGTAGFAVLLLVQVLFLVAPCTAQYGRQGSYGYEEDDMTDRAVEYYMMQQQASQQQARQQEEFIRQAQMQQAQQEQMQRAMQQEAMRQQQAAMQQEAMRQQAAAQQAMYEAELEAEERYYHEQMHRQQQAQAQQSAAQKAQQTYQAQFEQQKQKQHAQNQAFAAASLDDASTLSERGTMMMSQGNYLESLLIYDKCLAIQLHHLGDLHPMVAHTVDLMGVALLRLGAAEEALETFEKAVYIQEHNHGQGSHPDWALTVMHAGQAYELQAENVDTERAEKEWKRELDAYSEKAYELYEKALEVFQAQVEANEPDVDVANVVHAMGNVHNIRGEHMEALRKYKYALEQKLKIYGDDDVSVAWTKNNIGNAFQGMYKLDDAIKWYSEALATVTATFGADHPEVAHVHWNLALCYQTKGEVDAQKRKLGWHSRWPFTLFSQGAKRRLIHEGDDFTKMDKHLHHAFDVFVKRLGEDHVSTQRATQAIMAMRELIRD